jgi:signal transduction histidine kinase/CheY-like chemotaxis protein
MRGYLRKIGWTLLTLTFCLTCFADREPEPFAQKGLLDLRNTDLFDHPIKLHGEWKFYWMHLLSPDSLNAAVPEDAPYPRLWKDLKLHGRTYPTQGYATYALTVILPKSRPRIGLEVPDTYCSYKLFVNGAVQSQNGQPGRTKETSNPFWATRTVILPMGEPDTIVLVMQIANFWHAKGGPYKEILLGNKDDLVTKKYQDAAYDFFLGGCLFMGGLFFLGLFIFGRHDKTTLYFSLFCIFYSYRMVGTDTYALHSLFSGLNWFITIRIEYLSLSLSVALFTLYSRHLYPDDAHPIVMKGMIWLCHTYTAIILLTPTTVFTQFMTPFLVVLLISIAYAMFVYLKAARNKRSGSLFAMLSTAILLFVFLLLNLHFFGFIPALRLVVLIAYIAFFFLQSLSLSHRFAQTFKTAAIQAQQGLRTKSEFLSTMSHEIRTPLNAVIGMTHLLLRNEPRTDQKEDLGVLLFSANNLLSIVNNILDYNKIEEGKIGFEQIPMDLPAIARNIVAGLKNAAGEKGVALLLEVDQRLDRKLIGDPTRTSQVINNLVHNAIKFTKEGSVKLIVQADLLTDNAATITIKVVDTGIGIAKEKQNMIFDRFTQADSSTSRSYGGTGLGLAITKRILELQGVALQLKSEPGKGSEFYFTQTLNFSDEAIGQHEELTSFAFRDQLLKGITVLLVEDNPLNVLVAQTMLENCGATVDVATNGLEALEKLNAARHRLVLMDLHMPEMDGYEATVLLRKRGETLPIIALTASTPKEVESEAYAAGLTDIVVKPFNPDDLYRVILQHANPANQ